MDSDSVIFNHVCVKLVKFAHVLSILYILSR